MRYFINVILDVCAVRLDFETFTTAGPTATGEEDGGLCVDSLVVSGTSGLTSPVICGMNTGQHSKSIFSHFCQTDFEVFVEFSSLYGYGSRFHRNGHCSFYLCWCLHYPDVGNQGYTNSLRCQLQTYFWMLTVP